MMNKHQATTPSTSNIDLAESLRAIAVRMCRAFPELAKFFPWLAGGTSLGIVWPDLLDGYLNEIGHPRSLDLAQEVRDVLAFGLVQDPDFNHLVCDLLALDQGFLTTEGISARSFVVQLQERLTESVPLA